MTGAAHGFQAVIFDLGGVVMGSPIQAMSAYERAHGQPEGAINRHVADAGPGGAWARFERSELAWSAFVPAFEAELAGVGIACDTELLFSGFMSGEGARPQMLDAIACIRKQGLKTAALTNNFSRPDSSGRDRAEPFGLAAGASDTGDSGDTDDPMGSLREHFDVFIESRLTGLRKPDPRIYELVCRELDVAPAEAVFLDDIGYNLKPARAMGMATIRVHDPDDALAELEALLGFALASTATGPGSGPAASSRQAGSSSSDPGSGSGSDRSSGSDREDAR